MDLNQYFENLERAGFDPGWARKRPNVWPAPAPQFVPAIWRFAEAREALERAGEIVSAEQTERRNLIMVNPFEGNAYPTTRNLVAAYQMIQPGEAARSHRHTPAALRLVLEAGGETYTIVEGTRIEMAAGDVVLTPSWLWHGHANDGDRKAYWIDFLDVPLVHHLESMFFERHGDEIEDVRETDPDSDFRIPALEAAAQGGVVPIAEGVIPTIGLELHRLEPGETRDLPRTTANSIFAVLAGAPTLRVGSDFEEAAAYGDVVAVPCWHSLGLRAGSEGATLLRVTDAPLMAYTGMLRTQA